MYAIKKFLKAIIILIILLWVLFFGIILYAVITDYKPESYIVIDQNETSPALNDTSAITVLTWNIGYFGLDDSMDFFYDGGVKVMTPRKNFEENYKAVSEFLENNDTIDFTLLQEVDRKSKRSYRMDEFDALNNRVPHTSSQFAVNYDVFFVPLPPSTPMGKVYSGISTLSRHTPSISVRHSFPGEYGFPKQLFMLDRCFLVNHYPLSNGKELLVINTHNEAFDPGDIRKTQMEYLRTFIINEFNKGNYIIAGGDWNQSPPDFKPQFPANEVNEKQMMLETDYLPEGWSWAYDNTVPTNRSVTAPYNPAYTITTVIDFFLLSPNVESLSVKGINLNFRNSDHNPVILKVKLKSQNLSEIE